MRLRRLPPPRGRQPKGQPLVRLVRPWRVWRVLVSNGSPPLLSET